MFKKIYALLIGLMVLSPLALAQTPEQIQCEEAGGKFYNDVCKCPTVDGELLVFDNITGNCVTSSERLESVREKRAKTLPSAEEKRETIKEHYSTFERIFNYYTAVLFGGPLLMFIIGIFFLAGFRKLPHRKKLVIGIGLTIAFWLIPLLGMYSIITRIPSGIQGQLMGGSILHIVVYLPALYTAIYTVISAVHTIKGRKEKSYWIVYLIVLTLLLLALLFQLLLTNSFFMGCLFGSCI